MIDVDLFICMSAVAIFTLIVLSMVVLSYWSYSRKMSTIEETAFLAGYSSGSSYKASLEEKRHAYKCYMQSRATRRVNELP